MEALSKLVDLMADQVLSAHLRLMALQYVLEDQGTVSREAVEAKMRALDDAATLEIEYGPQHEEFRRVRRLVREALEQQEENRSGEEG